ncbi:polymorphic toxin-type HINT domain-containing protein [Streptomyces sp. NPDC021093]|uniref:polymorphic toxin-type HINT domain-containing protein n=1 Tax=Streptomyces sp. NPDC021093 TaxID=3365112 RepID=UPI0037AF3A13
MSTGGRDGTLTTQGLLYYRNRYYDPQTGRFISQDSIGHAGGTNLYQYALSSPTTYTDPSGNNPLLAGCVVGGLVDGGMDWLGQRLSGRKVNWGQVGGAAAMGCAFGLVGAGMGSKLGGSCLRPNSFAADTLVVMADGTRKPIKDIEIGDEVRATDPETGETGARTVTTLITGTGNKQLVDLTIDIDGTTGHRTAKLTATDGHPFWVPALHQWVDAGNLDSGQWLQTGAGTWVQIDTISHRSESTTVYNLTVDDLHTYYVGSSGADVLVHNSNICLLGNRPGINGHRAAHPDLDFHVLNLRGTMANGTKGTGAWNWTRNKRFIDDALARGIPIRLVTDPTKPLYRLGNVYQRELKYLEGKGYGWRKVDDYWEVIRVRP